MVCLFVLMLLLVLAASWTATLIGLPGNWLMVSAVAVYAYFVPAVSRVAIGWNVVVVLLALALLGEILEFLAGMAGAAHAGASKRSALLALLGSVVGAVVGLIVGLPIPLIGSLVATLIFAALGAMAGAMLGEWWVGRSLDRGWRVGQAAFWGRLAGTLGKVVVGAVMVATTLAAMVW